MHREYMCFNSSMVQLKYIRPNSPRRTKLRFNSSMVQLKFPELLPQPQPHSFYKFQFLYGTIKMVSGKSLTKVVDCFNSSMVQLKFRSQTVDSHV